MRDPLGDDLGRDDLPKVGGWVFLVVLPLVVAFVLAAVVVPLGSGGRRVLSIVSQIASARSEVASHTDLVPSLECQRWSSL